MFKENKNAQANSANPPEGRGGKRRVSFLVPFRRKTRVNVPRKQETRAEQQASPFSRAFSRHIVTHTPLPQPPVSLQLLLSLLLRFHHHKLSPPPALYDKAACAFFLTHVIIYDPSWEERKKTTIIIIKQNQRSETHFKTFPDDYPIYYLKLLRCLRVILHHF